MRRHFFCLHYFCSPASAGDRRKWKTTSNGMTVNRKPPSVNTWAMKKKLQSLLRLHQPRVCPISGRSLARLSVEKKEPPIKKPVPPTVYKPDTPRTLPARQPIKHTENLSLPVFLLSIKVRFLPIAPCPRFRWPYLTIV